MKNKALLIWNIAITLTLAMVVFSGCSSLDPQFASLTTEVSTNRALIEQLISRTTQNSQSINSNNTAITKNTLMISNMQSTTQAAIAASEIALKQYMEQFVQAYVQQAMQ